jgi:hypothetical protein
MRKASEEKRSYWRGVLRRQRESGLSVRQFCADEELSYASFYRWKRKMAVKDCRRASNSEENGRRGPRTGAGSGRNGGKRRQAGRMAKQDGSVAAFIPVRVQAAGSPLEVVHPRGYVVRVPAVFDADFLRQVLDVLDRQGDVLDRRGGI